ncbi:hypothetical protein DFP72DRAFT_892418, partial [Ephemerocybe angulata]
MQWSLSTQTILDSSETLDPKERHEKIRKRLDELEHEARALKFCNNSLAPVNRIPPEILSNIFHYSYLLAQERDEDDWSFDPKPNYTWIWVTHVCQRWREVGLRCPTLWAESLSFEGLEFAEIALDRSRDAPLDIKCYAGTEKKLPGLRKALAQMHRVRSLTLFDIDSDPEPFKALLQSNDLSGAAPILEELELHFPSYQAPAMDMPENLLGGGAPNLRRLVLSSFRLPNWPLIPLGEKLVYLDLSNVPHAPRPTFPEFRSSIRRMVLLKTLKLSNLLPLETHPSQTPSSSQPINFSSLEALDLTDNAAPIINTLRISQFSRSTRLRISIEDSLDEDLAEDLAHQLFDILRRTWDARMQVPVWKLEFSQSSGTRGQETNLLLWFKVKNASKLLQSPDLSLTFTDSELDINQFLFLVKDEVVLSQLRNLEVADARQVTQDTWRTLFGRLHKLKTIVLNIYYIPELIAVLAQGPNAHHDLDASEAHQPCFPALTSLDFLQVNLKASPTILEEILACLTVRSRCTVAPLKKTYIGGCDYTEQEDIDRIREACPDLHVIWGDEFSSDED